MRWVFMILVVTAMVVLVTLYMTRRRVEPIYLVDAVYSEHQEPIPSGRILLQNQRRPYDSGVYDNGRVVSRLWYWRTVGVHVKNGTRMYYDHGTWTDISGASDVNNISGDLKVSGNVEITGDMTVGDLDANTINDHTASAITTAIQRSASDLIRDTHHSWLPDHGKSGWEAASTGAVTMTGGYIHTGSSPGSDDSTGDALVWTMGSASTPDSVAGNWYRFTFTTSESTVWRALDVTVDGVYDGTIDLEGSDTAITHTYTTNWYQADGPGMVLAATLVEDGYGVIHALLIERLKQMVIGL